MTKETKYPILKIIPFDKKVTRKELTIRLNITDRAVRDLINQARKDTAILSNSTENGYRRAKPTDMLITQQDVINELNEIEHSINEIKSRINDFKFQERALIAHKKMIQKKTGITSTNQSIYKNKSFNIITKIRNKVKF